MPKPLLLRRPSGLYARFLLPADIAQRLGRRFLVRSLAGARGDEARLTAAMLGYALAQAIARVRAGDGAMDAKKLVEGALAAAAYGSVRTYELNLPGGISIRADSAEDHARAMEAVERIGRFAVPNLPAVGATLLPASPPAPAGPMLHAAVDRFLEQFGQKKRASATETETRHTLSLLRDLVDDLPLSEFGNDQMDQVRRCLSVWPARARLLPGYRELSARDIVTRAQDDDTVPRLSVRTLDKHFDRLRVFFNDAIKRGEMARNPLTGVRMQSTAEKYQEARRAFTPTELLRLFDPQLRRQHASGDPTFFWVPMLMLFTGARMNELVYLDADDVEVVAGVMGLHLRKAKEGKLKNAQSRRFVPVPAAVLALGFADYVRDMRERGQVQLFPGGSEKASNGRGDRLSKWFNRTYLRRACGILDDDVCLQAFRNTFLTAADRAGIPEARVNPLVGHGPKTIQQKHYIDPPSVVQRQTDLDAVGRTFTLPSLAVYEPGQFEAYFVGLRAQAKRAEAVAARAARHARSATNN